MTALLIILAVIVLLLLLPVGVHAVYSKDGFTADLLIGPFPMRVFPPKPGKAEEKNEKEKKEPEEKKTGSVRELFQLVNIFIKMLPKIIKKVRINRLEVFYVSADADPYSAALRFGMAESSIGILTPILENHFKIGKLNLQSSVDFNLSEPEIYADGVTTASVGSVLFLGVYFLLQLAKIHKKAGGKGSNARHEKAGTERKAED